MSSADGAANAAGAERVSAGGVQAESQTAEPSPAPSTHKSAKTKLDQWQPLSAINIEQHQQPCLLLEHATLECVPVHVRQLLEPYALQTRLTQAEKLWLLVYIVALECGFAEPQAYDELCAELSPVPVTCCFHAQNVRRLTQQSPVYSFDYNESIYRMPLRTILANNPSARETAEETQLLQTRLIGIVSGDLLIVTLCPAPPTTERGYSVCLSIGRYVLNMQVKNKPLFYSFRKLDELSLQLREKLFQPMRAQQLAQLDAQIYPTLVGLPAELYDEIFRHLNENQLKIVANVNRHLNYYSVHSKYRISLSNEDDDKSISSDRDRARERGLI